MLDINPQFIHSLSTGLSTVVALLALGLVFRLRHKTRIGKLHDLMTLNRRVEDIELRQGDLADRFKRFQNRENMRKARETTLTEKDQQEWAEDVLSGKSEPESAGTKARLYKQLNARRSH